MLEETYLKIISAKTAELFAAATKVGAILSEVETKEKESGEGVVGSAPPKKLRPKKKKKKKEM